MTTPGNVLRAAEVEVYAVAMRFYVLRGRKEQVGIVGAELEMLIRVSTHLNNDASTSNSPEQ